AHQTRTHAHGSSDRRPLFFALNPRLSEGRCDEDAGNNEGAGLLLPRILSASTRTRVQHGSTDHFARDFARSPLSESFLAILPPQQSESFLRKRSDRRAVDPSIGEGVARTIGSAEVWIGPGHDLGLSDETG